MGTSFSSGNNVAVWCDKPEYFPGDIVQGYVLLNVCEPFGATSVILKVKGYESASWVEITQQIERDGDGNARWETHRRHCSSKNDFFKIEVPLYMWDGSQPVQQGQYQFPFRVTLPFGLPGTFLYKCGHHGNHHDVVAKIIYKVKACVLKTTKVLGMTKDTELKGKQEVVVRQLLVRPPAELAAENVVTVRKCCLWDQGMVVVRLRAVKDAFMAGEAVMMVLEIENHTNLEFKDVSATIERRVHLKASHSSHCTTECVVKEMFPGIPGGMSCVAETAKQLTLPLPVAVLPTTLGHLITCTYSAHVELSAGMCTNNPRLMVPLTIYASPPLHNAYGAAPPAFWQPVVTPAVDVPLTMAAGAAPFGAPYPVNSVAEAATAPLPPQAMMPGLPNAISYSVPDTAPA